jgi:hypothetical protein
VLYIRKSAPHGYQFIGRRVVKSVAFSQISGLWVRVAATDLSARLRWSDSSPLPTAAGTLILLVLLAVVVLILIQVIVICLPFRAAERTVLPGAGVVVSPPDIVQMRIFVREHRRFLDQLGSGIPDNDCSYLSSPNFRWFNNWDR